MRDQAFDDTMTDVRYHDPSVCMFQVAFCTQCMMSVVENRRLLKATQSTATEVLRGSSNRLDIASGDRTRIG